jgi:DNA-binding transcriptional MerR regulator
MGSTGTAVDDLLTTRQVAEEHDVTPQTVNRWVREGRLVPATQGDGIRGPRFYRRADVVALIDMQTAS